MKPIVKKPFGWDFWRGSGPLALAGLLLYSGGMLSQPVQGPPPFLSCGIAGTEIPCQWLPNRPVRWKESSRPPESAT